MAGSVRLKKTAVPDVFETGMWLARSFRGQGAARAALAAVLSLAAGRGYATVTAETDAGNQAALGTLRSIGFDASAPAGHNRVTASIPLAGFRPLSGSPTIGPSVR